MSLIAKDGGNDLPKELCPVGPQNGICYAVADLGRHDTTFKDKQGKAVFQQKCVILFESEHCMSNGKRFGISEMCTLSLNKKAKLRGFLESWRGKEFTDTEINDGFDIDVLTGVPATMNIVQKTKKDGNTLFSTIQSIMPATANNKMVAENSSNPDKLPDWVKEFQGKAIQEDSFDAAPEGPAQEQAYQAPAGEDIPASANPIGEQQDQDDLPDSFGRRDG